jgi:hypothetical protein
MDQTWQFDCPIDFGIFDDIKLIKVLFGSEENFLKGELKKE